MTHPTHCSRCQSGESCDKERRGYALYNAKLLRMLDVGKPRLSLPDVMQMVERVEHVSVVGNNLIHTTRDLTDPREMLRFSQSIVSNIRYRLEYIF